jgi:site-specific recombinase XerD
MVHETGPYGQEGGKWRVRHEAKEALATVTKDTGVEWCSVHTLGHTLASQLVITNLFLYNVSQWLGQVDVKTSMIYAHLAPVDSDFDKL